VHAPSRRDEGNDRRDGREHAGPDSITDSTTNANANANANRNATSDSTSFDHSGALADANGNAVANDFSATNRDRPTVAAHDRDSGADDRHAKPDSARNDGSLAESNGGTNGVARCDRKPVASAESAHSTVGRSWTGLDSERSGPGCRGASARRRLALDDEGL